MKTKTLIGIILLLFIGNRAAAADWWPVAMHQPDTAQDSLYFLLEAHTVLSAGTQTALFIAANENGNISAAPFSGNLSAGVLKPATRPNRWYDWNGAVVLTGRFDTERNTGYFQQLYAHVRLYIIDITAGITPLYCGSQNKRLSMGGMLFSGNAQPLPRISIGIDRYTPFPGLFGYVEVRGGLTHGWFVDAPRLDPTVATPGALLHYKFAGIRFGGSLPVNISYELHHAAEWGGVSPQYGAFATDWNTYKHIFLAQGGGNHLSDQLNAEGNHIGFQELAVTAKWQNWQITAYWQTLFEDMSANFIGCSNQTDGLWGISLQQHQWSFIHSFTYEFMNTTAQDGPFHDKDGLTYGGRSGYYNNSSYAQGWTHFGRTIGNPFLRPDNNRVRTHFAGIAGDIYGFEYRLIAAYTRNWGTYQQPAYSHNTALMVEVNKKVEQAWGLEFGLRLAADFGTQYDNRFGALLTVRKQGLIAKW